MQKEDGSILFQKGKFYYIYIIAYRGRYLILNEQKFFSEFSNVSPFNVSPFNQMYGPSLEDYFIDIQGINLKQLILCYSTIT